MESRWRFNVWDFGLNVSNLELIARTLDPPFIPIGKVLFPNPATGSRLVTLGFDPVFGWTSDFAPNPGPGNFPWGIRVEPDSPT